MSAALHTWLTDRGGLAHTRTAKAAGHSAHRIAEAVASGTVRRVRRSWLAAPDCPPDLLAAVSAGGRLSCVSAAAARGLWVAETPALPHVAVARSAHVTSPVVLPHWAQGPVPMPSVEPREHELNILFHVARCLPRLDALAVWESALRLNVVDPAVLGRVKWRSTRAAELAAVATALSDSGIETAFVELMRGCGIRVRQQVWVDGHPLDGLIGDRLGVQIDGFAHHRADDRRRDLRADARLALRGYTLLRFDYQQVLFDPDHVRETVLTAVAQRLHLAP